LGTNESTIFPDNLPQRQIELAPPLHIGSIAKGADHENASAFFDARAPIRKDRHRHPKERRNGAFTKEWLISGIFRMGNNSDTGSQ
jgi:hypothetical protein